MPPACESADQATIWSEVEGIRVWDLQLNPGAKASAFIGQQPLAAGPQGFAGD